MLMQVGEFDRMRPRRGTLGLPIQDARGEASADWYILTTPPQREDAARAWLLREGVADVWFPTETVWRTLSRPPRRVERQKRIAPGYVFVLFDREPVWDVIFAMGKGRVSGVVGFHERPYAVPLKVMEQMAQVPKRIEIIREAESHAERMARLERQPRPGDFATIKAGPLAGFVVGVDRIDAGIAHFLFNGFSASAQVEKMERLA